MNNNFSLARTWKLVVTDLASNRKQYLMWIGLLAAFMLAWTIISLLTISDSRIEYTNRDPMRSSMQVMVLCTLMITIPLSASLMMNNLSSKTSRINALMLPALPIEKFMARWVIFVPLYFVVFLAVAQCVDLARCVIEVVKVPIGRIESANVISLLFEDFQRANDIAIAVFWVLVSQSVFVLGSSVWPKMSIVKTSCFLMAYGFLWTVYGIVVLTPIMSGHTIYILERFFEHASRETIAAITYTVGALWALVNYSIAFWRYRDTEIVQRW